MTDEKTEIAVALAKAIEESSKKFAKEYRENGNRMIFNGKKYRLGNEPMLEGKTLQEALATARQNFPSFDDDCMDTGVVQIDVPEIDNFNGFVALPQLFRLILNQCIIHSFEGLIIPPYLSRFELHKSIVHSYKGLSITHMLCIFAENAHEKDALWKYLLAEQQACVERCFKAFHAMREWEFMSKSFMTDLAKVDLAQFAELQHIL